MKKAFAGVSVAVLLAVVASGQTASKAQPLPKPKRNVAQNSSTIFNSTLQHDDDMLEYDDTTVAAQLRPE